METQTVRINGVEWDVVSVYTRKQAIEDGVLVDVSETAREAGIRFPVALSAEVYARYVAVPEGVQCQDEAGRLWDILWMLRCSMGRAGGDTLLYQLHVRNNNRRAKKVTLKALCGPGDDAEPVVTVMLPEED